MIEKERKFKLIKMPVLGEYFKKPKFIKQGYLLTGTDQDLRIRIVNNHDCYFTYKKKLDKETRRELEFKINCILGHEMYNSCEFKLEKKRFTTYFRNKRIDIDVYPSGLEIVEIEYENELKEIPDYCGEEVTDIEEFSNVYLAKTGKEFF